MSDIEVTLDELKHGKQFGNITFQMPEDEEVIDTIIGTLEKQLNGGWIPCSEKLPTTSGRFEVTIKGSKGKRRVEMWNFNKDATLNKWEGRYYSPNIIAWRSRPEPYKED